MFGQFMEIEYFIVFE